MRKCYAHLGHVIKTARDVNKANSKIFQFWQNLFVVIRESLRLYHYVEKPLIICTIYYKHRRNVEED